MKTIIFLFLMAGHANAAESDFCRNPLAFTCKAQSENEQTRQESINQIEESLKTNAFKDTLRDLQTIDPALQLNEYGDIDSITPKKRRSKIQKIFYSNVRVHFAQYLKENLMPADIGFGRIKDELSKLVTSDQSIPADTKNEIQATLSATQLISLNSEMNEDSMESILQVYKRCSKNNFEDNAFATEIKSKKVVIVCPGEIIGSVEFIKSHKLNPKYSYVPLMMTLGHELSHHFDYRYYPDLYKGILSDLSAHQDQLSQAPENFMSEVVADSWGLKATRKILESSANLPVYSTLLAGTMSDLCGTEDDGVHPSGDFRISFLAKKYLCE